MLEDLGAEAAPSALCKVPQTVSELFLKHDRNIVLLKAPDNRLVFSRCGVTCL